MECRSPPRSGAFRVSKMFSRQVTRPQRAGLRALGVVVVGVQLGVVPVSVGADGGGGGDRRRGRAEPSWLADGTPAALSTKRASGDPGVTLTFAGMVALSEPLPAVKLSGT